MQKMSFAMVKAHLSEIVDQAEHHEERIIILRHGKPAAAIVPVDVAVPNHPLRVRKRRTREQAKRIMDELIASVGDYEPEISAVDDLLASRR